MFGLYINNKLIKFRRIQKMKAKINHQPSAISTGKVDNNFNKVKTKAKTNAKNPAAANICECGNTKRAYKPTCSFCSFCEWIRGTGDTIPTKICACGNPKKAGALSCDVCDKALRRYLDRRVKFEGLDRNKLIRSINKHGIGVSGKCSLCGENYIFGGNNPQPVIDDYDARCCDKCDDEIVGPARINHIKRYGRAY